MHHFRRACWIVAGYVGAVSVIAQAWSADALDERRGLSARKHSADYRTPFRERRPILQRLASHR
jgi:hypothetical protein